MIELSMFLDDWSAAHRGAGRPVAAWRRPVEAARLADPDPYRDRLRQALLAEDARHEAGTLKALAAAPDAADLPAPTAVLLGSTLADNGEAEAAVALLRPAASRHPDDVWVNHVLALALDSLGPSAREESLRYYTANRTLRPETGHQVAHLLERMGRGREAEAVLRHLVGRRPEDPHHLVCLANHLKGAGRPGEAARFLERAVASARAAIRRKPDDFDVYIYLAPVLAMLGKVDEAIAEYRVMIRLRPDYADGRVGLGVILAADKHDYAAAEAEYLEAIRLKPDSALAHYNLGHALGNAGKTDLAIAAFREAIRLKPAYAQAHHNLGVSLQRQGAYAEAAAMLRKARELGSPTGELVAVAEPGSAESLRKRCRKPRVHGCATRRVGVGAGPEPGGGRSSPEAGSQVVCQGRANRHARARQVLRHRLLGHLVRALPGDDLAPHGAAEEARRRRLHRREHPGAGSEIGQALRRRNGRPDGFPGSH